MKPEIKNQRIRLAHLLQANWKTVGDVFHPGIRIVECMGKYEGKTYVIRITTEYRPDGDIRSIKLAWTSATQGDKMVTAEHAEQLIKSLSK